MYAPVLFLYVPDHWCSPHPSFAESNLTLEEILDIAIPTDENGDRDSCQLRKSRFENGEIIYDQNLYQESCPFGWQYNFTNYFTSAATEVGTVYKSRVQITRTNQVYKVACSILDELGLR